MPKVPDGEMTRAELVRLIKKYNEKMGIDPKGKSRDQLIKEIESLKYKIDHQKKDLVLQVKQKVKKQPRNVKADPIKQKTELQKQKASEKKEEKEMEKKKELRKVKKEVADKIINREKRVKDKSSKNSTTKMKKENVGKVKFDPKKVKVVGVKGDKQPKKEDEVRPAKRVRRNPAPVKKVEQTKEPEKNPDKIEGGNIQVIVPSLKGVFESTPKKMYEVLRKMFPQTFKLKKGSLEQFGDSVSEKQAGVETLTANIEETMKEMKLFKKYMETFKKLNKEVIEKYGNETGNFYDLIEISFIPAPEQIFDVWFKNRVEFKNAGFEPHNITKKDEDFIYSIKLNKSRRKDFIDTMRELFNTTTDKIDVKFE